MATDLTPEQLGFNMCVTLKADPEFRGYVGGDYGEIYEHGERRRMILVGVERPGRSSYRGQAMIDLRELARV